MAYDAAFSNKGAQTLTSSPSCSFISHAWALAPKCCLPTFYNRSVLSQTCSHFQSSVSTVYGPFITHTKNLQHTYVGLAQAHDHSKYGLRNGAGWVPFTEMLKPRTGGITGAIAPALPHTLGTKSVSFWLLISWVYYPCRSNTRGVHVHALFEWSFLYTHQQGLSQE